MITIDPPSSHTPLRFAPSKISLTRFLARARSAVGLEGKVALLLTWDGEMRRLNRRFRGKNKTTDVLSFPAAPMPGLPAGEQGAGDLAISIEVAAAQAERFGHSLNTEIRVLILHGLLHLAGYDHETDEGEMAARELELRTSLRLPAGLIDRTRQVSGRRAGQKASGDRADERAVRGQRRAAQGRA